MMSSSNKTHASVLSVAGCPSFGTCWMKSLIGGPSRVDLLVEPAVDAERLCQTRTARTTMRPFSPREITSGGTGGGGISVDARTAPRRRGLHLGALGRAAGDVQSNSAIRPKPQAPE